MPDDLDCPRCRGGGCEWCQNTGKRMVLMPLSDANNLDAVVHELEIEDSDTTPAEAVKELKAEIERLRDHAPAALTINPDDPKLNEAIIQAAKLAVADYDNSRKYSTRDSMEVLRAALKALFDARAG